MNYLKLYNALIEKSKNRLLEGYSEKHHIIPKCLGGSDDSLNLAILTPEEHYVAHQLLVKMHPHDDKILSAAIVMGGKKKGRKQCNNKIYGWLKKRMSKSRKGKPGHPRSEETRKKMSESHKKIPGKPLSNDSIIKRTATRKVNGVKKNNLPMSQETKDKISKTLKEKNIHKNTVKKEKIKTKRIMSQEQKDHLSTLNKGKKRGPQSQEIKDKISAANNGRKRSAESCQRIKESKQDLPIYICPHCDKSGRGAVMHRHHFNNCKSIIRNY